MALKITERQAFDFYSELIHELIHLYIKDSISVLSSPYIFVKDKIELWNFHYLIYATEFLEHLNGIINALLSKPQTFEKEDVIEARALHKELLEHFLLLLSPERKRFVQERVIQNEAYRETLKMIDDVIEGFDSQGFSVSSEEWLRNITTSTDLLNGLETEILKSLKNEILQSLDTSKVSLYKRLFLLSLLFVFILTSTYLIGRQLTQRVRIFIHYITTGESLSDFEELIKSKDEIGEIARALAETMWFAETDFLTQIYNRRKFEALAETEIERAIRYQLPLSLILFDIDNFKKINDTYGHDVGDEVLKTIASVVSENVRKVDIFARFGGEEFVILSPHSSKEDTLELAERLRKMIESLTFSQGFTVTCSFGVTDFREGDTLESLIKRADEALYQAKRTGKNRVCLT